MTITTQSLAEARSSGELTPALSDIPSEIINRIVVFAQGPSLSTAGYRSISALTLVSRGMRAAIDKVFHLTQEESDKIQLPNNRKLVVATCSQIMHDDTGFLNALDLSGFKVTSKEVKAILRAVSHNDSFCSFNFSKNVFKSSTFKRVINQLSQRVRKTKGLDFTRCGITKQHVADIEVLQLAPKAQLDFSTNSLREKGAIKLVHLLTKPNSGNREITLKLKHNAISNQGAKSILERMQKFPGVITCLDISENPLCQ